MAYNVDRYVVERLRPNTAPDWWVGMMDFNDYEEAQVHLAKCVIKFAGQWRIRDRWNAVKEPACGS